MKSALIRQGMDGLQKTMMNELGNDTSGLRMGSALVLSAPGKEPAQFFAPRAVPAEAQASDSSLASLEAGGIAVSDLPRYRAHTLAGRPAHPSEGPVNPAFAEISKAIGGCCQGAPMLAMRKGDLISTQIVDRCRAYHR